MGKIKVSLANGTIVEKPLVTCFQGSNGSYLVLDNETNGSMGLPIICISKYNNGTVSKISDPNEWTSVKENLKTIIAGTNLPYIQVPESLTASDDFYTQLTLPVASFDLIKNVYKPIAEPAPVEGPIATPVVEPVSAPAVEPVMPTIPEPVVTNELPATPVVPEPVSVIPEPVAVPSMSAPLEAASLQPAQANTSPEQTDIAAIKENFMKSCENMFDALIKQFNK